MPRVQRSTVNLVDNVLETAVLRMHSYAETLTPGVPDHIYVLATIVYVERLKAEGLKNLKKVVEEGEGNGSG